MAVNRFAGMGWLLCGMIAAPACYLVNSYGAAEQAKLNATKAAIVQAQKDIRGLETEFNTRANLAQLERWNGEVLSLAAATPQQYLASETALADLDRQDLGGAQIQTAALIVPAGAPAVQTAAAVVVPAAVPVQGAPQSAVAAKVAQQGAGQDKELRRLMTKADKRAVAMVDKGVLSASTIDDLEKLAKREKLALR
ncbi:hypothetical protein AB2M62_11255 [Sphingomonas sp. MMS12-HWE2-04]|uniref:hypothetical protein n=1 Tax=Sphingomonas sp. MMS12-HWE2-04 TaxID=3234199 RepID=UPI00384D2B4A